MMKCFFYKNTVFLLLFILTLHRDNNLKKRPAIGVI